MRFVPYFPRPLGWTIAISKAALLWQHDRIHHLLSALTHALVTYLFWRLLRQLLWFPQIAAGGALLFLTFPLSYEIILWPSAMHAGLATAAFLGLAEIYLRFARGSSGWVAMMHIMLLCFVILCLWEQPATGVVALPLLYFAVCPASESFLRRAVRSLLPVTACCALVIMCMWITRQSLPAGERGSADSLIGPTQLKERIQSVGSAVLDVLGPRMRDQVCGGLKEGLLALRKSRGLICLGIMALAFVLWLRAWWLPRRLNLMPYISNPRSPLWIVSFGAGIIFMGWLPVVAVKMQTVETRLFYYPLLGAIIIMASLTDWHFRNWAKSITGSHSPFYRCSFLGAGACIGLAAMLGAICLVGAQQALRQRYRMDRYEMAQLRRLFPDPPVNTIFVPLRTERLPVITGYSRFDQFAIGALATPWSAPAAIQQAYRRRDLFSTYYLSWGPLPLNDFDASSARYHVPMPPFDRDSKGGSRLPYEKMLPFTIDENGDVSFISLLWIEDAEGKDVKVVPSTTGISYQVVTKSYILPNPMNRADMKPLSDWKWTVTKQPVLFQELNIWNIRHPCASVHPSFPGDRQHGAMQTLMSPCLQPSQLYFRATFTSSDLCRGQGDGVDLIWYLNGQRGSPLVTLHLTPQRVIEEHRWVPISMTLPAHQEPLVLQLEVGPGPAGNFDYDGCYVTIGQSHVSD